MTIDAETSLATLILELMSREHKKGVYIYTFEEAVARDEKILAEAGAAGDREIRVIERCFGEAQIEMLYHSSDAALVGVGFTQVMKHAIFLEYLDHKMTLARHVKPASHKFRSVPRA